MARKLTAAERKDLAALTLAEQAPCTVTRIDVRVSKTTRQRAQRRGWLATDPEYSDCVRLTFDGEDYLAVLREFAEAGPTIPAQAGPTAVCWEHQAGELPVRLSFSVLVF